MRALMVLALLLTACGGAATAPSSQPAASAAATASAPAAAATTAAAPSATQNAKSLFAQIAGAGKSAQYKVSFKVTTTGGGASQSLDQTWYVKGLLSRFDIGAGAQAISLFDLADGTFICTGSGGDATCFGGPKDASLSQNPAAAFDLSVRDKPDAFDPTFEGTRTIAGQSTQCFAVKGAAAATLGEWRMCYTSGGVPLLMQTKAQGFEYSMEATSFSSTVSDADFKLPASPTKVGP